MAQLAVPMMIAGSLVSASGTLAAGKAQEDVAKFEAAQLDQRAMAERATASRDAAEARRQGRLAQSRLQAVAASSGGGQPIDLVSRLEGESEYNALRALYEGDERAAGFRMQGAASRFEGRQRRRASRIEATGTLIRSGASLLGKYG